MARWAAVRRYRNLSIWCRQRPVSDPITYNVAASRLSSVQIQYTLEAMALNTVSSAHFEPLAACSRASQGCFTCAKAGHVMGIAARADMMTRDANCSSWQGLLVQLRIAVKMGACM